MRLAGGATGDVNWAFPVAAHAAGLPTPKLEPVATRLSRPGTRDLRNERFMKIVSLAPEVL